jgi:hypothetical protein
MIDKLLNQITGFVCYCKILQDAILKLKKFQEFRIDMNRAFLVYGD